VSGCPFFWFVFFGQAKKMNICFCLAAVFILVHLPLAHGAEEDSLPWKISADQITHQQEPEKIIAEGRVILQQFEDDAPTGRQIEADRIQYNIDENSLDAAGNLHLKDNYDEIRASEAQINLDKQIGFFKEASLFWQDTKLSASADLIEKTALKSYHFVNGKLSTCPPEKDKAPDWSIWGRDVEITLDDYAKLRHATFRIKDVPVFYLPYLRMPIRNEKKSGLLFPEYSSSDRNGTGIIAPVFFNLSPSYDMTLYPGYYSDRGPLLAGEFRYIANFNSRGTFLFNYLDDELEDTPENDFKSDGILRTNSKRYWVRGKADHDFGDRLVAKLDIDLVSDRDYLQEFRKGLIGFDTGNSYFLEFYNRGFQAETVELRENTLQLSKVWTTTDLQAEINVIDDLRDDPEEVMPPWALPRVGYSGLLPFLQTPIDLTWGSEYVYYWRDEGVGAHRVDLFPQLNGPITFSPYLEASYLVGLRETLYFIQPHDTLSEELWDNRDFEHRTFYNVLLTGATTLSRDYDISIKNYTTFRHAFRPELSYILLQGSDQDDLPILDNEDRILEKNWLQYGLNNYFRAIRLDEHALFRKNFSSFKMNQVYDIDAGDHPFSDLYFEFIVRGFENLFFRYETTVSVYDEGVTTYGLETRYKNRRGDSVNIDYRYKLHPDIEPPYFFTDSEEEPLHEIRANLQSRLSRLFSIKYDTTYSLESESTVDSTFSLIYHNPCWTLEFAASRNVGDNSFYLLFSLAGIGTPIDFGLPEF
jgi:LPS-assembly protein